MKAILFDLDGVFYEGDSVVTGGAEVIKWVREQNIPYLFVSNITTKNRLDLVAKLFEMGITVDISHILTPPVAAVAWLQAHNKNNIALYVPYPIRNEFSRFINSQNNSDDDVDALVIGDLGKMWTFEKLNEAFQLLVSEPQPTLLALGMTRYSQTEDGLRLDVAPFVMALQYASMAQPVIMGKPSPDFYRTALSMLETDAEDTVIIGDDLFTDIEGGQQLGMRGLLVRTGKFMQRDLQTDVHPFAVLDSIADLPDWWRQHDKHR
ncbi:MAG: HAD-IIA family hydrolase [Gammaproteobacteria bacterium]|nr:HAD-IIA family hydrolase [Gammaproteobacteria bacterium]